MKQALNILFVEDNPQDVELALHELRREGFDPQWSRVETEQAFLSSLHPGLDIILSDFRMPQFDGLLALRLLMQQKLGIPFIIVSGTIGEETAVEAIKQGATDYLLKDRLARLGPAIRRALEQSRVQAERRKAEEALRESEDRFRQLVENINEVIWMTDPGRNRFLYINPAYESTWGRTRDELYSSALAWIESIHPEDRERIREASLTKPLTDEYNETYRIVRPDGSIRWIRDRAYPIRDKSGEVCRIVGVAEDFTENKLLEEKYLQAQRMEAIGTLAGGIAHDFNNILSGIVGFNSLARRMAGNNSELLDYLNEIGRAGSRAADLVRQILSFSRTDQQQFAPVQLRHIVAEAVQLLRAATPSTIDFEVSLASNMPAVLGNATQLHQVMMNLGTNACYAMRRRPGQLRVELTACAVQEEFAHTVQGLNVGSYVKLTVADTGCGIEPALHQRVFEPFFTTKGPGEGSGLGLSVVHGIMRNHQGAIRLISRLNEGTTFELYFPAIAAPTLPVSAEPWTLSHGQGERILFVDDELTLVRLGERMLRSFGYTVEGETQVQVALARVERDPEAYQLVITDQTMPGMTGLEFAAKIHALRPGLPVILTSGYSMAITPQSIEGSGIQEFISKPYTMANMAAVIQRHLPTKALKTECPNTT